MDTLTLPFEIKSLGETGHIEGLISAFGKVDGYGDTIQPGAYAKTIAELGAAGRKLPLLYQHDAHRPIGVWNELREADDGLYGKGRLTMASPVAQEAHALARDGALTGISIGFNVPAGGAKIDGDRRTLTAIDLKEASLVTFPADDHARIHTVKSIGSIADIRDLLQSAGLSGRLAKAAAGAAWRAINETDDDAAEAEVRSILNASAARIAAIGATS